MRTMRGDPCLHYDCMNRNSFGYCKTTACINPKYSNIGTAQYGQGVQKRIATNADRIRTMSDGELAQFLMDSFACSLNCPAYDICDADGACVEFLAKWLKQEAEE